MPLCLECRYDVEADDVEIPFSQALVFHCICVACYHRSVDGDEALAAAAGRGMTPLAREVRRMLGPEAK